MSQVEDTMTQMMHLRIRPPREAGVWVALFKGLPASQLSRKARVVHLKSEPVPVLTPTAS